MQDGNAHPACIGHVECDFGCIVARDCKQRGHVFGGIIRLQVSGLYGDDAVIRCMAFIEAIPRKLFPVAEDQIGGFLRDAILGRACDELFAMLLDL